jgi:hypothetical protein
MAVARPLPISPIQKSQLSQSRNSVPHLKRLTIQSRTSTGHNGNFTGEIEGFGRLIRAHVGAEEYFQIRILDLLSRLSLNEFTKDACCMGSYLEEHKSIAMFLAWGVDIIFATLDGVIAHSPLAPIRISVSPMTAICSGERSPLRIWR